MTPPTLHSPVTGQPLASVQAQVAPGKFVVREISPEDVPRWGICRMLRLPDGTYRPVLQGHGTLVRLTTKLMTQLGLGEMSIKTMRRLIEAGFIKSTQPSPQMILIDLGSVADHLAACEDPEFWTPARRANYTRACNGLPPSLADS